MHLPRTLHDDIELETVTEIIDLMAGHPLNKDQSDYLETLAELAEAYESANPSRDTRKSPTFWPRKSAAHWKSRSHETRGQAQRRTLRRI